MRLAGICLITKNVRQLSAFYSAVLGVEADGDDSHAEVRTSGAGLAIFSVEGMEKLAPGSMSGAGVGSFTIGFSVEDMDAEYEKLRALGIEFLMPPTTHPWGWRSTYFRDPDRNIVSFVCRLS